MTWIATSDPLALMAIQAGQINAPNSREAASAVSALDAQQRYTAIGEPVPIVFCRFQNGAGGILVSPGATEARFENDIDNNVTAYYHLVISEGRIDSIPVKDVFQRACRVGTFSQSYGYRAGTWAPGNFIVQRVDKNLPQAPYFCGTVGAYSDMSTLSFQVTIPDGFDYWNRQVHLFVRGGMYVTRLLDSVYGPSDNFADLAKWLLERTARVPSALIDTTALIEAATFLSYNGLTCNCILKESTNYGDLIAKWAPYFLLCESNNKGKKGLRPLLPTNTDGSIKTTAITPAYLFNESMIVEGSFELEYLSYADRQPFVAQIIWRQQIESGVGIPRTSEIRYADTASGGPYESHDLSAFCTQESHAVKIGAYMLAKRIYTTHTIRFRASPQAHNTLLEPGDIVRVQLEREATNYVPSTHNYLYQIERITKTLAGEVTYEATHFPVDSQNRSLVALDVVNAPVTGLLLTANQSGISCDINSSTDNTIPLETFTPIPLIPPIELPQPIGLDPNGINSDIPTGGAPINDYLSDGGGGGGGGGGTPQVTAKKSSGETIPVTGVYQAKVGDTLAFNVGCPGAYIEWRLVDSKTGDYTVVSSGVAQEYIVTSTAAASGKEILGVGKCPDGTYITTDGIGFDPNLEGGVTGCTKAAPGSYLDCGFYGVNGEWVSKLYPMVEVISVHWEGLGQPQTGNPWLYIGTAKDAIGNTHTWMGVQGETTGLATKVVGQCAVGYGGGLPPPNQTP